MFPSHRNRATQEYVKQRIIELKSMGLTRRVIAERLGIGLSRIDHICQKKALEQTQ